MGVLGLWTQAEARAGGHSSDMKLFTAAALFLALGSGPAHAAVPAKGTAPVVAAPADKDALVQEMDDLRDHWLKNASPSDKVMADLATRLTVIRAAAEAADGDAALAQPRRDFHDWKEALYHECFARATAAHQTKLTYPQYVNALTQQTSFAAAARRDVMVQAAHNSVLVQQMTWQAEGTGDGKRFFDFAGLKAGQYAPTGFVAAAVSPKYRPNAVTKPVSPDETTPPPAPGAAATSPGMLSRFISSVSSVASTTSKTISTAIYNYAAGVQKFLTTGLIQAESGFHTVGSWAGCFGIAQFSEGAARMYHVIRGDATSSVKGAVAYQRDLQAHFAKPGDPEKLQALFVEAAARYDAALASAGPNPSGQAKQKALDAAFHQIYSRIPYGIENAIAGYNAGQGAIDNAGGWTRLPLPRGGCVNRPAQDNSYCQTMAYVPRVLENSLNAYVSTRQRSEPLMFASN